MPVPALPAIKEEPAKAKKAPKAGGGAIKASADKGGAAEKKGAKKSAKV